MVGKSSFLTGKSLRNSSKNIKFKILYDCCKHTSHMGYGDKAWCSCVGLHTLDTHTHTHTNTHTCVQAVTIMYCGIQECHGQQASCFSCNTDSISEMTNNNPLFSCPVQSKLSSLKERSRRGISFVFLLLVRGTEVHTVSQFV